MLKEILAVSGKPGLYKLVSRGKNLLIIESLADKKRIPAYARDKVISLGDISIYTDEDEVSIREVLNTIKEKEGGKLNLSIDLSKAKDEDLRTYFTSVLPNFDKERVYTSDIKKLLKWYEILMAAGLDDFSQSEEDEEEGVTVEAKDEASASEDDKDAKKATKAKSATKATSKRKESSMTAAKQTKATAKPNSKTSAPKKSVVGAKRGG